MYEPPPFDSDDVDGNWWLRWLLQKRTTWWLDGTIWRPFTAIPDDLPLSIRRWLKVITMNKLLMNKLLIWQHSCGLCKFRILTFLNQINQNHQCHHNKKDIFDNNHDDHDNRNTLLALSSYSDGKKRIDCDKCFFATKQHMFGVLATRLPCYVVCIGMLT